MAAVIRLARHGRKKLPFYRIVVADKDSPRDGRFLELVGTLSNLKGDAVLTLKEDRIKYWVGVGAQPSDTVAQLIEKKIPGYLSGIVAKRTQKIRDARKKRKAKSAGKASPKKEKAAKKPAKAAAAKKAKAAS